MILMCNYEELRALKQGASAVLGAAGEPPPCAVAAPSQERVRVEALAERLEGDFQVQTLAAQRELEQVLRTIVACLETDLKTLVRQTHPGDEEAVDAYFDFAHAYSVLERVSEMGREMEAMIELMTGEAVTSAGAETFQFPD